MIMPTATMNLSRSAPRPSRPGAFTAAENVSLLQVFAIVRLTLIAISLGLAPVAGWNAALGYWGERALDSNVPHVFASSPRLKVLQAEHALPDPEQQVAQSTSLAVNARSELRGEPFDAMAVRQLAMVLNLQKQDGGRAHLLLAERITRRDLANQFELINTAARAGDVSAALLHYNRALLREPASGEKLFPILARALDEPTIRVKLVRYASQPWFAAFVTSALANKADPLAVTALLSMARSKMSVGDADQLTTSLVGQLVAAGKFTAARDIIRQAPRNLSSALDEFGFSTRTTDPRLAGLGWALANDDAVEVTMRRDGNLDIRITSEQSGTVAERVTFLAAGAYTLTQELKYTAGEPRARLTWTARCLGESPAQPLLQNAIPLEQTGAGHRTKFVIPSTCEAQAWRLSGSASTTQFASTARIARLTAVHLGPRSKIEASAKLKNNLD